MGHYYAEMMCDECGHLRCTCARKSPAVEREEGSWVVTPQFDVVRGAEYKKKLGDQGFYSYMLMPKFSTEAAARRQARLDVKAAIAGAKTQLAFLQEKLKSLI